MAAGGNAVDAAIAANAVLGVVAPDTCGLGGDLFALIHTPGLAAPAALNASGRAGSGAIAAELRDRGIDEVPLRSAWSVTVPGCVDGWEALLERFGTRPLGDLLAPAIDLATTGFVVSNELADSLRRIHPLIGGQGSAPSLYPGGVAPAAGARLTRPRLAETLRLLAAAGRESFYGGRVGEEITVATDGVITAADLEHRNTQWVDPISVDVFGQRAWTIPPNSQGWLTLAACWLFEQMDPPRDPEDPAFYQAAIEAYRAVAWERDELVSDPDTAPLPADQLADPDRLRSRLERLSVDSTADWPAPKPAPGGTAYFCVRDGNGMGVSFIQSNFHGIGSGLSAGDTGVFLHNRGAGFNLISGHPNEMSPGRRPLHTLSPSLWTEKRPTPPVAWHPRRSIPTTASGTGRHPTAVGGSHRPASPGGATLDRRRMGSGAATAPSSRVPHGSGCRGRSQPARPRRPPGRCLDAGVGSGFGDCDRRGGHRGKRRPTGIHRVGYRTLITAEVAGAGRDHGRLDPTRCQKTLRAARGALQFLEPRMTSAQHLAGIGLP